MEMFRIIANLDKKWLPATFIGTADDALTSKLLPLYETSRIFPLQPPAAKAHLWQVPRPRRVGQSYLTAIFTTIWTIIYSIYLLLFKIPKIDLLLCNGPGICVCIAITMYPVYWIKYGKRPKILFIECFARTRKLSLSGKIMLLLADKVIVQWPSPTFSILGCEYLGGPLV